MINFGTNFSAFTAPSSLSIYSDLLNNRATQPLGIVGKFINLSAQYLNVAVPDHLVLGSGQESITEPCAGAQLIMGGHERGDF